MFVNIPHASLINVDKKNLERERRRLLGLVLLHQGGLHANRVSSRCICDDWIIILCNIANTEFLFMKSIVDTTIRELYKINPRPGTATIAAIIYMFVEPEYRKLGVGSLALEVISAIHSIQAVDFTVLVADDNGSGGLVKWYESNGFSKAPLM